MHSGYHGIFHKVNKEMMILGLVSFATFVVFEATNISFNSPWYVQYYQNFVGFESLYRYNAFEFAHLVVLFIALAFVLQALLLTKFITVQRHRLYTLYYSSETHLVEKYDILKNYITNVKRPMYMKLNYLLFHLAPLWFPCK